MFVAFGVGASLTFYFRSTIFLWLLAPAGGQLSGTGHPIFTGPTEMFGLTVSLAMKGGIVAAAPVLVYHTYRILSPLFNKGKRREISLFLALGFILYLGGTSFAYFVLLPTGLRFLLTFGTDIATPMIRITEYMTLALAMIFWLGIVFELPLLMLLLTRLRVMSHTDFKKIRRYVPAMAFILGAIITPTFDIVNQTLVAVPLIALFEVGVFLSWMARPRQVKGIGNSD